MQTTLHTCAALGAALVLAGAGLAQNPFTVIPGGGSVSAVERPAPQLMPLNTPVPAERLGQTPTDDAPWGLVAPYAWIFGMHGTIGARTRTVSVDESVSDAVSALSDVRGAAQLHGEAGYGDFGLIADLTYFHVVPLDGRVRVDSRTAFVELLGMYRLLDTGPGEGGATFDLLAGVRYYRFKNSIHLEPVDLTPVDRTTAWVDPIVGARGSVKLSDDLALFARGDIGGFDIGQGSRLSCNALVGFEYQCTSCLSLTGGYRWMKIDRHRGEGEDRSVIDVTISGPFVALGLRY